MKNRILRSSAALLLALAVCLQLTAAAYAASAKPTDIATAQNVLEILSQYDADAYHIMKTEYDSGEDFMFWFFGGSIISQIDTAVHETYHSYTFHQSDTFYGEKIYLGGGTSYDVDYSVVYQGGNFTRTEEMSRQIPASLQTFRYADYVGPGSNLDANTKSVFGLLNEFTAYYWGLKTMNSLSRFLIDTNCGIDGWKAYIYSVGNNMTAYAEFKYWTLRYMMYIQSANPTLYAAILDNGNYCAAYRDAEEKFAAEMARSRQIVDDSAAYLQKQGLSVEWSDDAIRLWSGNAGTGVGLENCTTLMAELAKAEYVEMDAVLKSGGGQQPQTPAPAPAPSDTFHAVLSPQNLTVNGVPVNCEKYNIDGSNYFKLRDIAYLLQNSDARFSVLWDAQSKTVSILSGQAYTPDGSELVVDGTDRSGTAVESGQTILVNGVPVADLSVYNIGGNNYFRLRDLADILGFGVGYDAGTNTAMIEY